MVDSRAPRDRVPSARDPRDVTLYQNATSPDSTNSTLPRVSVVIPVYNGERYIGPCVESVVSQDYPNLEVIVVDDGSTDATPSILQQFGSAITVLRQENAGSAVARNLGVDHTSGDYVAFNDGDDLWAPGRLRQQVRFLEANPDYGIATGRFQHVGPDFTLAEATPVDDEREVGVVPERSGWVYHTLFETSWYHIIAAMVRREVIDKVRFIEDFRRGQDYDYWLQLAHHARVAQLDTVYAYYRKNADSISHRPHRRNYRAEIMRYNLQRFGAASQDGSAVSDSELARLFHKVWLEHGYELMLAGWHSLALKSFARAIRQKPGRISGYKFFCRSLLSLPVNRGPDDRP